jgi:ribonuclease VapC
MIVVDTSALMAIVLDEAEAGACMTALETNNELLISAGTIAEALIVASRRSFGDEMTRLINGLGLHEVVVTSAAARRIALAYQRWGKGSHAAGLNFGDCFAIDVAKEHDCPLLFIGEDFAKTDLKRVL